MKIHLKVEGSRVTHYYALVDEDGNLIENATFIDFDGTKTIYTLDKDEEVTYIKISIPSNKLYYKEIR
jgi:hypothetical protein